MSQYDAGPGDRSDREWETPEHQPQPHARRRGPILPPWALLVILVGALILLCVGLVLGVNALRNRSRAESTPEATATNLVVPISTWTPVPVQPQPLQTASPTVELPSLETPPPQQFTEIAVGATVVVQGVGTDGLNVRADAGTAAEILETVPEGTNLVVLEGPQEADGLTWWKVRTPAGQEGWAADTYLVLAPNP